MAKTQKEAAAEEVEEPIEVHGPWEDAELPDKDEKTDGFVPIEEAIDILKSGTDEQVLEIRNVLLDYLLDYKDELDFQEQVSADDEMAIAPYIEPEIKLVLPGVTIIDEAPRADFVVPRVRHHPVHTQNDNENTVQKLEKLRELVNNTAESDIIDSISNSNWGSCPHVDLLTGTKYFYGGKRGDSITIDAAIELLVLPNSCITEEEELEILDWAIDTGDKIVRF